jgi:hypothetical protein
LLFHSLPLIRFPPVPPHPAPGAERIIVWAVAAVPTAAHNRTQRGVVARGPEDGPMDILRQLTLIALRQFVDGSCPLAGRPNPADGPDLQVWFLHRLFSERAAALDHAARDAARAWKALETTLARDRPGHTACAGMSRGA